MTREQAITTYVENLIGDDLAILLQHMNGYDDFTWVLTDKELASLLFKTGTTETTTGNWIFTLEELDGRTPEQALVILYAQGYQEYILDAECTDDTLDIIFSLDVCPNVEQEEER